MHCHLTLTKRQILDFSKLKEFADDNSKFDENGRKFSTRVDNTVEKEKLRIMSNFSFSCSVFERLVLQTCKNQRLLGKRLIYYPDFYHLRKKSFENIHDRGKMTKCWSTAFCPSLTMFSTFPITNFTYINFSHIYFVIC